jgi:adenylate cyclase
VFLATVAFLPLFTMLGLVRAARVRFEAGIDMPQVLSMLDTGSTWVFGVYVTLGLLLTLLMAGSFTGPLAAVAAALRRIQRGDLDVRVPVVSGDEIGLVEQGVNDMAQSLRERERILAAFGRVVEPAVRDKLLAGGLSTLAEKKAATVLFCDLRGFTAFAERTPPEEVVATLNEFFTSVTQWVRGCGGFVDKFIGDALLVVFGLFDTGARIDGGDRPAQDDAGARTAVDCALGIRERLLDLNRLRAAACKPELSVAMAIHTGEVLAGLIGAEDRHEYTVIGDTVNSAARLLDICKERNGDLIVSGPTFERATRAGAVLDVRARDSVKLRGRAENVTALLLA